ncbi:MAG: hypothetical protein WBW71_15915, partial [Bacteroidota bacterium]
MKGNDAKRHSLPFLFLSGKMLEERYNFLTKKYREMSWEALSRELLILAEYKNDFNDKRRDEYYLVKSELEDKERRIKRLKEILVDLNSAKKDRIPDFLFKGGRIDHIPEKALRYLVEYGYEINSFEKIITEERKGMIFLSSIEHVTEKDILNIDRENGRFIISLRLRSGNISSFDYEEIREAIDEARRIYETRKNLANYCLTMPDSERAVQGIGANGAYERTMDNEKKWLQDIEEAEIEIKNLQKLEHLFWQTVEKYRAKLWPAKDVPTIDEKEESKPN